MRESEIEKKAVSYARKEGWLSRKLQYVGRVGAPDRMFIRDSIVVFVEFKRPGGKMTVGQQTERKELRAHGANAYTCDNFEDFADILNEAS